MSKILYFCHKISFHGKNKKLIIVIAALIVVIAGVSFLAFNEFRKNKEMTEVFAVEKERWKTNTALLPLNMTSFRYK